MSKTSPIIIQTQIRNNSTFNAFIEYDEYLKMKERQQLIEHRIELLNKILKND